MRQALQVCGAELDAAGDPALTDEQRFEARSRMAAVLTQRVLSTVHTIGKASRKPIVRTYLCFGVSDEHTLQTPWPNDGAPCALSSLIRRQLMQQCRMPSIKVNAGVWRVEIACVHLWTP